MPIKECGGQGPRRWRIGSGNCIYTSYENAKKAYIAYLASHPDEAKNPIGFDFDSVLSRPKYQELAARFISQDKKVVIVTARPEEWKAKVYEVADKLGIPHSLVYFTGGHDKWQTVKRLNLTTFYDNSSEQIKKINENTNCVGILAI